jgi:hypothetical protein
MKPALMARPQKPGAVMRVLSVLCLSASLLAGGVACFRAGGGETPEEEPPTIEVRNRYLGAVVVYLIASGNSQRLGMIQSNRTENFRFPVGVNPFGPGLRLVADPVGDFEAYTSETLSISSGVVVVLTIENELRHSNVIIR